MEREHQTARADAEALPQDHESAPGRGSRSAQLAAPANPIVSGLIQRNEHGARGGAPLPAQASAALERSYGANLSSVRVHTGAEENAAAASLDAEAFAAGEDVYFANGSYDPASEHGAFVLAHEVAHVVQSRGAPAQAQAFHAPGDESAAEGDADRAAEAALTGRTAAIQAGAGGIHRFSKGGMKRDVDDDGNEHFQIEPGGHAYMTAEALRSMGLSYNDAARGYHGNWMRDLSQIGTPGLLRDIIGDERLFALLNILSIKEVGRGLDAKEFGTYDPVEHMDNPGGARASDTFKQTERGPLPTGPDGKLDPDAVIPLAQSDVAGAPNTPAGGENEGYGKTGVDPRYTDALHKSRDEIVNQDEQDAFKITARGMPVYMSTSVEWARTTLHRAALIGRTDPLGAREFASGTHAIQDYYAHSNFCEIAINLAIKSGTVTIPDAAGRPTKVTPDKKLDTKVHANDAQGEPIKSVNLRVKDLPGFDPNSKQQAATADREVMTTGTFNMTDSMVSLLYELKAHLLDLDPFKEKGDGPSPLVNACLDYMDMTTPDTFNGTGARIAALIEPVGAAVKQLGETAAAPLEAAGSAASWGFDRLNDANAALGGDADWWDASKKATAGGAAETAAQIRQVTGGLSQYAASMAARGHLLRDLYREWKKTDLLAPIKEIARTIPVVGEQIVAQIASLERSTRELLDEVLHRAWSATVKTAIAKLQKTIDQVREQTNLKDKKHAGKPPAGPSGPGAGGKIGEWVEDAKAWAARKLGGVGDLYDDNGQPIGGIAPKGYTSGSHSEIAKDHHHEEAAGERTNTGHHDEHGESGHDHIGEDGEAAHEHASDWLNPLAETLASKATMALGARVKAVWDVTPPPEPNKRGDERPPTPEQLAALAALDGEIDHYMRHPEDCRDTWTAEVNRLIADPAFAARLRGELG